MPAEQTDLSEKPLIFISHSSKDKLVADAICARLENHGIRCWIAPRDVNPGRDFSDQIAEALEKATVMVMVVSSGSNSSRHVKSEIDRAFSLGQIIVPFRVEKIELDKGLAYYLSKTHWLDAVTPPLEQHIDHLAATIQKLTNQDPLPVARPPSLPVQPVSQPAQSNKLLLLLLGIAGLVAIVGIIGFLFLTPRYQSPKAVLSEAPTAAARPLSSPAVSPSRAAVSVADQLPIEGTWTITEARTLDGTSYDGTVQFFKQRDRYQVMWQTAAGNYSGVGLVRGNKVCVGWSERQFGVVFYAIGRDGTLSATWTVSGAAVDQNDGVEKAVGGTPGKIEGDYSIVGSNPGSTDRYEGKLKITRTGETYQLRWNVDNNVAVGVGIKINDDLFVTWGDKDVAYSVVAYTFDGDRAKGVWTLGGESQTGTEDLVKQ